MPLARSLPRGLSRNNSLPGHGRLQHATAGACPAAYRRPSTSTDRDGGSRAPSRSPSIAAASIVAVLLTVLVVLGVFCQPRPIEGGEGGGVLFVDPLPLPPVVRGTGPYCYLRGGRHPVGSGFLRGGMGGICPPPPHAAPRRPRGCCTRAAAQGQPGNAMDAVVRPGRLSLPPRQS